LEKGLQAALARAMLDTKMRRRAAAPQPRFLPQYLFVRLSVSAQFPAGESKSITQQKSPRETPGGFLAALLLAKSAGVCGAGG
jgi:hypothetical protein